MIFASNPLLMFRQFVFLLFASAGLTALAIGGLFWLGMESTTPAYAIACLSLLSCIGYVAIKGRVRVEVTDDEVVIARPCEENVRLSRARFAFSARVVSHSVNLIPTETERILIASNDDETHEIPLVNLAKRPFDAIMAVLLKDRILAEIGDDIAAADVPAAIFAVPKEAMLAEFRKLIAIFAVGGAVLSAGLIGFIGYMLAKTDSKVPVLPMLVNVMGFCLLLFVGFGIPILMTYRKRDRGTPATVRVDGDSLDVGEERFTLAEIRRIVATPPDYTAGDFVASRRLTIWTDRGKTAFNFGVRTPGGVWKTVFGEYGDLCRALEKTAARQGFEFVYDL